MTEEIELTEITKEILSRADELITGAKNSMSKGEKGIINGICIFKDTIKGLNPSSLDIEEVARIQRTVDTLIINREELTQHVDNYIHIGIQLCYWKLDKYLNEINSVKRKERILTQ